jgi:hypothetical protein
MATEELRWEVAFLASSWLIPRFHADFPGFTSKIVEHSRYLLSAKSEKRVMTIFELIYAIISNEKGAFAQET